MVLTWKKLFLLTILQLVFILLGDLSVSCIVILHLFTFKYLQLERVLSLAFWGEKRERDLFFIVHIFPVFSVSDPVPFVRIRIGQKIRIQSGKSRSGSMRKTPKTCKNCTSIKNVIPVSYLALSTTPFFGQALLKTKT